MKKVILNFLTVHCSSNPNLVDKLLVSSFIDINRIIVTKNGFIKQLIISRSNRKDYKLLEDFKILLGQELDNFTFEHLIEIFEFVISPADKIVTGAIYTPKKIRDFLISRSFDKVKTNELSSLKMADIACGCGSFLFDWAKEFKKTTRKKYSSIFKTHLFGLDIQEYSIQRTKVLLCLLAISEREDVEVFEFNIYKGDALNFSWDDKIKNFKGFHIVLGNPPYVCSRNIPDTSKIYLSQWSVCSTGHPDLYIPFFQIGIENLLDGGLLGFITMNSFFKSLNGRALRAYFQSEKFDLSIIDFGTNQIFKSRNTYTCICEIHKTKSNHIKFTRSNGIEDLPNEKAKFDYVEYSSLDSKKGWNLKVDSIVEKIEKTGKPFSEIYKTRNGIATLKNNIYIFKPGKSDKDYYYIGEDNFYPIEKGICRNIINSNKFSRYYDFNSIKEKIIFPYTIVDSKPVLMNEIFFQKNYPKTYQYLLDQKEVLATRDKGEAKMYEKWYAFGRTQSLDPMKHKLFFPHITDQPPVCVLNSDENLLFYNGLAIIGETKSELDVIKKLFESRMFFYYIRNTSKPYASDYYSLSSTYIRNFGIYNFTADDVQFILKENDKLKLDLFFEDKYKIKLPKG